MKKSIYKYLKKNYHFSKKMIIKKSITDEIWFEKLQVEASKIGARVHLLKLRVDYTKPFNDAVMAGGPQTSTDSCVFKVFDKYQTIEKNMIIDETIILLNWEKGYESYQKAVEWGLSKGLKKTTYHVPFTIGEQFPNINYEIGSNPMYIIETTGGLFGDYANCSYCVWWYNLNRTSDLYYQGCSAVLCGSWFAFRKKQI